MSKRILVIGGTRFFGLRLVEGLLEAGHAVTLATRGRAADPFGDRVQRIRIDRRDRKAMAAAFERTTWDLVYDQMCYSPRDAAISTAVFAGRVGRYLMASTIEVYRPLRAAGRAAFGEDDLDLSTVEIGLDHPWDDPARAEVDYDLGKRQAEAWFHRHPALPVVAVRIGHVLSGPDDFTGRLAGYVARVRRGEVLRHSQPPGASSFIHAQGIADFLRWAGEAGFTGPINAADTGALSALDLHRRVGAVLGRPVRCEPVPGAHPPAALSAFDFATPYVLDTTRARALGYRFAHTDDWLDAQIRLHADAANQTQSAA